VWEFLHFFKQHNLYYANVTIRPYNTIDLPDNANILQQLPVVNIPTAPSRDDVATPVDADEHPTNQLEAAFVPDELALEQNLFVSGIVPGVTEADAVHAGVCARHFIPNDPIP
jgi:hypothetical protein